MANIEGSPIGSLEWRSAVIQPVANRRSRSHFLTLLVSVSDGIARDWVRAGISLAVGLTLLFLLSGRAIETDDVGLTIKRRFRAPAAMGGDRRFRGQSGRPSGIANGRLAPAEPTPHCNEPIRRADHLPARRWAGVTNGNCEVATRILAIQKELRHRDVRPSQDNRRPGPFVDDRLRTNRPRASFPQLEWPDGAVISSGENDPSGPDAGNDVRVSRPTPNSDGARQATPEEGPHPSEQTDPHRGVRRLPGKPTCRALDSAGGRSCRGDSGPVRSLTVRSLMCLG